MLRIILLTSIGFVIYTYLFYPIQLLIQSKLFHTHNKNISKQILPLVSIIIAVYNEASNIGRRINNLLDQKYPKNKIEIIVVSDGSTDGTQEIVKRKTNELGLNNVLIVEYFPHKSKAKAINEGVKLAKGDIIVFTDARQSFNDDSIFNLITTFNDDNIGCVSGELIFRKDSISDISEEVNLYWKYEKFIRKAESSCGSMIGATGAIYAIRKELFSPIETNIILDDVLIPMKIATSGKRVIFNPKAIAYDKISSNLEKEYKRKVRTLAGNWQLFGNFHQLYFPFKHPLWYRFLVHKVFRLFVPVCLFLIFICSIFDDSFYSNLFAIIQTICYLSAFIALNNKALRKIHFFKECFFFASLNYAIIEGFFYFIKNDYSKLWSK